MIMREKKGIYEIEPYAGVGPIRFGMSIAQVRQVLAAPVESFCKSETTELPTDSFDTLGIHVYYKLPGICTAIEFGNSQVNPTFQGRYLLNALYYEVKDWFRETDPDIDLDNSGLTSFKFGIGLYAPTVSKNQNQLIEGVIVFEKGYYDRDS
jgi:hypothetical protein